MPDNQWNTSLYDQKHAFVFEYGKGLVPLLDPKPGESILDLGCGSGHLAHTIAQSGAHVIGIDGSASMIEAARVSYPDIEFLVADARDFSFPFSFDAIFSNATLHWIREADEVVQRIATALKPGGRLVTEFGGKGNVETIITAVQQSLRELAHIETDFGWYFPSIGEYASLLEQHGLAVQSSILFDRPTLLEDGERGLRNWIQMFGDRVFVGISDEAKEQVLERTEEKVRDRLFKDGQWFADYRRLRIVAYQEL
jgi:trans-aconitate methyltransferase